MRFAPHHVAGRRVVSIRPAKKADLLGKRRLVALNRSSVHGPLLLAIRN
jgi:hypothetical protein